MKQMCTDRVALSPCSSQVSREFSEHRVEAVIEALDGLQPSADQLF